MSAGYRRGAVRGLAELAGLAGIASIWAHERAAAGGASGGVGVSLSAVTTASSREMPEPAAPALGTIAAGKPDDLDGMTAAWLIVRPTPTPLRHRTPSLASIAGSERSFCTTPVASPDDARPIA